MVHVLNATESSAGLNLCGALRWKLFSLTPRVTSIVPFVSVNAIVLPSAFLCIFPRPNSNAYATHDSQLIGDTSFFFLSALYLERCSGSPLHLRRLRPRFSRIALFIDFEHLSVILLTTQMFYAVTFIGFVSMISVCSFVFPSGNMNITNPFLSSCSNQAIFMATI